jgi:hypothetical protein
MVMITRLGRWAGVDVIASFRFAVDGLLKNAAGQFDIGDRIAIANVVDGERVQEPDAGAPR